MKSPMEIIQETILAGHLASAIRDNDSRSFDHAVKSARNFNIPEKGGNTPLAVATKCQNHGFIEILLAMGADPNIRTGFPPLPPPLGIAAYSGDCESMKILLDKGGADPCIVDERGVSPLHIAANLGFGQCVRVLLNAGADPSQTDTNLTTPVAAAASRGDMESLAMLLAAGGDPNFPDMAGLTPLSRTAAKGYSGAGMLLVEHGADPYARDGDGNTAFDVAAYYRQQEWMDAVNAAIEAAGISLAAARPKLKTQGKSLCRLASPYVFS